MEQEPLPLPTSTLSPQPPASQGIVKFDRSTSLQCIRMRGIENLKRHVSGCRISDASLGVAAESSSLIVFFQAATQRVAATFRAYMTVR